MNLDRSARSIGRIASWPGWRWLALAFVAVAVLLLLAPPVLRMQFKLVIDYNEGWNAYHTARAMAGDLYSDRHEWTPLEYPPLSFYVVGLAGKLIGDPVIAGRYISFAALLFVALGVGLAVRRLGGRPWEALCAAFLCLGLFASQASYIVGMNDPQMLGHAFMVGGMLIYLGGPTTYRRLCAVALLFCAGLFVKYNLVPLPAAVGLDLLIRSRKQLFAYAGFMALIVGAGFLAILAAWGRDFVHQLEYNVVTYDIHKAIASDVAWVMLMQIPLVAAVAGAARALRQPTARFLVYYVVLSLALGFYEYGGNGTDVNMMFDALIGVSIVAGLLLHYLMDVLQPGGAFLAKQAGPGAAGPGRLGLALLPLALSVSIFAALPEKALKPRTYGEFVAAQADFLADVAFLQAHPGPAICETILLCYYAGKPFSYDPFNAGQMLVKGLRDEKALVRSLEDGLFAAVQTNHPLAERYALDPPPPATAQPYVAPRERFTENTKIALGQAYVLARQTESRAFYVPRVKP